MGLLYFSHTKYPTALEVVGDSKFIIEWVAGKANIQVSILEHRLRRICQLPNLPFLHVYIVFNQDSNSFSKRIISLEEGFLFYEEVHIFYDN